ncbi:hypothetical protein [Commensalibacter nepenthis]|uniref:Uncharacterized protein n=1 Tax=Commensalibacter nepenthis TaxID=3043872 RepID=A0ABT6Q626_9PROT|nr:hypothetical protein [Commensalibacter sp. TBRC 10068]MDI2112345.1 hypothetical protein [Commensalibacter sp. TBRC 10068]
MNIPTDTTRTNERLSTSMPEQHYTKKYPSSGMPISKLFLTIIWAICHFAFFFIQQVAEIFAPLLLLIGIVWKILPSLLRSAVGMVDAADPQIRDMVGRGTELIPSSLTVAGHTISASSLIFDGFLLIGLTALCATITAFLGRRL